MLVGRQLLKHALASIYPLAILKSSEAALEQAAHEETDRCKNDEPIASGSEAPSIAPKSVYSVRCFLLSRQQPFFLPIQM